MCDLQKTEKKEHTTEETVRSVWMPVTAVEGDYISTWSTWGAYRFEIFQGIDEDSGWGAKRLKVGNPRVSTGIPNQEFIRRDFSAEGNREIEPLVHADISRSENLCRTPSLRSVLNKNSQRGNGQNGR